METVVVHLHLLEVISHRTHIVDIVGQQGALMISIFICFTSLMGLLLFSPTVHTGNTAFFYFLMS